MFWYARDLKDHWDIILLPWMGNLYVDQVTQSPVQHATLPGMRHPQLGNLCQHILSVKIQKDGAIKLLQRPKLKE